MIRRQRALLALALGVSLCAGLLVGSGVLPSEGRGAVTELRDMQLVTTSVGWALTQSRLARTDDGGATWRSITPIGVQAMDIITVDFLSAQQGWVVVATPVTAGALVMPLVAYRTVDGGTSWIATPIGHTSYGGTRTARLHFGDAADGWLDLSLEGAAVLGPSQLFVTSDGGVTWTEAASPARGRVSGSPALTWIAGGSGGGVLASSSDSGKSWSRSAVPVPASHQGAAVVVGRPLSLDSAHAVLPVSFAGDARPGIGFYSTVDAGATWQLVADIPTDRQVSADIPVATALVDGQTWIAVPPQAATVYVASSSSAPQAITTTGLPAGVFDISFASRTVGWASNFVAGPMRGRLFATTDGGHRWRELAP